MEIITLEKNRTWANDGRGRRVRIACREGLIWVTRAGDRRDYILRRGESFDATGRGRVVVWALDHSRLAVETPTADAAVPANPSAVGVPLAT